MDSKKQILIDTRSMFKERSVRTDEEQTNESKLQKRNLTVRENRTKKSNESGNGGWPGGTPRVVLQDRIR